MPGRPGQRAGPAERSFGRHLRDLRQQRGLTQEQLADLTGCDRGYLGLLERGTSSPTLTMLLLLAAALGVTAAELVTAVETELATAGPGEARAGPPPR
jgi:XRE family transcriptional regulator, regulator of sulfur utilization